MAYVKNDGGAFFILTEEAKIHYQEGDCGKHDVRITSVCGKNELK